MQEIDKRLDDILEDLRTIETNNKRIQDLNNDIGWNCVERIAALESEVASLKEWLYSAAWASCDCTAFRNSAKYDPREHEETCEYRGITTNVHIPGKEG